MGVLEDKRIVAQYKIIPTCVIMLTFFLRFSSFYEVPGITIRNGWAAPIHSQRLFLITLITFLIATWIIRSNIIRVILQISSLAIILYCEKIFIDFSDYKLKWTSHGFWINLAITVALQIYCLYIFLKNIKASQ